MDHEAFFKGLGAAGVDFLVTGGLALNLHGLPRLSTDIDLVLGTEEENIRRAAPHFQAAGYRPGGGNTLEEMADPQVRRRWLDEGIRVVRLVQPGEDLAEVDIAVEPHLSYAELKERAARVRIIDTVVPVMSLADLKGLKKVMGRPRDLEDLEGLAILEEISHGGQAEAAGDQRGEQIAKFLRWSAEVRCQWLLTSSQLQQQHSSSTAKGRGSFRGGKGVQRKKIPGLNKPDLS